MQRPAVLFVCLGNICRSPLAEAAFRLEADRVHLDVFIDSAGTGNWHEGEPPDPRACEAARRHGQDISHYRARQIRAADFQRFTHIIALDHQNLKDLTRLRTERATAELSLLLDHAPGHEGRAVADPYYGGDAEFERTWREVTLAAQGLAGWFGGRQ